MTSRATEFESIVGPVLPRHLDRQYVTEQILQALRQHAGSDDFAVVGGQVMRLEQVMAPTGFRDTMYIVVAEGSHDG